jgi:hypothetical protein
MHRYDVRASDLDRERAVEFLKAHYADGRLQADELAWRTDAAYRAVGLGELDRLTADLPAVAPARSRRRRSPLAVVTMLAVLLVAVAAIMPPDAWPVLAVLLLALAVLAFASFLVVAPIAIPVLFLAWIAHLISRATRPRPRPQPQRVGWR